jgi:hypothetical protein
VTSLAIVPVAAAALRFPERALVVEVVFATATSSALQHRQLAPVLTTLSLHPALAHLPQLGVLLAHRRTLTADGKMHVADLASRRVFLPRRTSGCLYFVAAGLF